MLFLLSIIIFVTVLVFVSNKNKQTDANSLSVAGNVEKIGKPVLSHLIIYFTMAIACVLLSVAITDSSDALSIRVAVAVFTLIMLAGAVVFLTSALYVSEQVILKWEYPKGLTQYHKKSLIKVTQKSYSSNTVVHTLYFVDNKKLKIQNDFVENINQFSSWLQSK